ncbi:MAG: AAA family ATPase [Propionibacteriaceae bacterium]|nr:AAA family ATPase [Propionibacteriaceae bacterium]
MLTWLRVDGFKNLLDFECFFGPYTCIAGPNAVGKSNLFDAIEFMSLLADYPFLEAAQRLRMKGDQSIDPRSLFWGNAESPNPVMELAAEMIVPQEIQDDFGRSVRPTTSFLRYTLQLRYDEPRQESPLAGGIRLVKEELTYITQGKASERLPWPHRARLFRDHVVTGKRSGKEYISTTRDESGGLVVSVHQDGGSRGKPLSTNPDRAPRTVVSTTTSVDSPTILAARREMQRWRMLALEPSAMRSPDSVMARPQLADDGSGLAATLFHLAHQHGDHIYAEVAANAAELTDVREVSVDHDERRDTLTLYARVGNGPLLPARSLSDGTLRFLALCVVQVDESMGSLLCLEEPENGIHPGRMNAMVQLVHGLAVDPTETPGDGNPLRQVMVNTHSPYYIRYDTLSDGREDVLAAMAATTMRDGKRATTVRLRPITGTWRAKRNPGQEISVDALADYLQVPDDALVLPWSGN